MLKPAMMYKDMVEKKFAEVMYTDDYFFYTGYGYCHGLPIIKDEDNEFRWVSVDKEGNVIGYLGYWVDAVANNVSRFGLYSFDKGNPLFGKDVFNKFEELVKEYHRIEWCGVGDNPVIRHYIKACEMHGGNYVVLHDTVFHKGKYHDTYIFEIIS